MNALEVVNLLGVLLLMTSFLLKIAVSPSIGEIKGYFEEILVSTCFSY
jgi:hypothetical protein